jgi:hypothetical protein
MLQVLAATAIWTALAITLGVLLADASRWIRQRWRDRMK